MKIGIYREFSNGSTAFGGAEFCVAALAESLENQHEVEIIHDNPSLTRANIEEFFGIDLRRTRFRAEQGSPLAAFHGLNRSRWPWAMRREAAAWNAHLSQ